LSTSHTGTPASRARKSPLRAGGEFVATAMDKFGLIDASLRGLKGRYIMAYHRVLEPDEAQEEWCHSAIWVRPQTFEAHLEYFARIGRIVSLDELLSSENTPERPLFAITFDDAWTDNFRALPILERFRVRACFFVPTDAVTQDRLFWTEELAQKIGGALLGPSGSALVQHFGWPAGLSPEELLPRVMAYIEDLKELSPAERTDTIARLYADFGITDTPIRGRVMSWDQVRELARQGHDIGSHSKTHLILRNVPQDIVDVELRESKRILENELQKPIEHFCFPNARYDETSAARVSAAGYRFGFRMHNLPVAKDSQPTLIPRFSVSEVNAPMPWFKIRLLRSHLSRA
jgi:peptidoglycan/xylan/chitin deacetylase (PgdA/CDA1 family)